MYSNETENYKLPQWTDSKLDHPDFLGDLNPAFNTIDRVMKDNNENNGQVKEQVETIASNMVSIQEEFQVIKNKVDSLVSLEENPIFEALKDRVKNTETQIESLISEVDINTNSIETIRSTLSGLSSSITSMRVDIDALHTENEEQDREIENIRNDISTLNSTVSGIILKVNSINVSLEQVNTDFTNLESRVITNEREIEDNRHNIISLTTSFASLERSVSLHDADIESIHNNIALVSSAVTILSEEKESEHNEFNNKVTLLERESSNINTELITMGQRVDELENIAENSLMNTLRRNMFNRNFKATLIKNDNSKTIGDLIFYLNDNGNSIVYFTTDNNIAKETINCKIINLREFNNITQEEVNKLTFLPVCRIEGSFVNEPNELSFIRLAFNNSANNLIDSVFQYISTMARTGRTSFYFTGTFNLFTISGTKENIIFPEESY